MKQIDQKIDQTGVEKDRAVAQIQKQEGQAGLAPKESGVQSLPDVQNQRRQVAGEEGQRCR